MFLKAFEGWHILIILGLFVVLFGARKLPDSARSIGQSLRIFKSEMKAAGQDGETEPETDPATQGPALEPGPSTASSASVGTQEAAQFDAVRR